MEERKVEEHPSFGVASFSHVSGHRNLFQSEFRHHHFVTLTISRADRTRDLSNDWVRDRERIVEVAMSAAQFVELISSPNKGVGTPVTIRWVQGEGMMPECPARESMKERHASEISEDAKKCVDGIREGIKALQDLVENGKLNKTSVRDVINKLERAASSVSSGIPFVEEQFREAMENTVSQARVEIEAHISQSIRSVGLQVLQEQSRQSAPRLIEEGENTLAADERAKQEMGR